MIGTLLNAAAAIIGSLLGLGIGARLPDQLKAIVLAAIGLIMMVLGMASAIKTENPLIPLLSLVIGALIGEVLDLDEHSWHSAHQIANMLPALILAPLIVALLTTFGIPLDIGRGAR